MRNIVILFLFAITCLSCSTTTTKETSGQALEASPFPLDSLMRVRPPDLLRMFTQRNLKDTTLNDIFFTMVYPNDTHKMASIMWVDRTKTAVKEVMTGDGADSTGYWVTRDGIRLGMPLSDVEAINGNPMGLQDYRRVEIETGFAHNEHGKVASHATLYFRKKFHSQYTFYNSDDPAVHAANPRVLYILLQRPNMKPSATVTTLPFEVNGKTFGIPFIQDWDPENMIKVGRMNGMLMGRLHLTKFDRASQSYLPDENKEFTWRYLTFETDVTLERIVIHYRGEHQSGEKVKLIDKQVSFDINSGMPEELATIPLAALLGVNSYWKFMDEVWLPGFYKKYNEGNCEKVLGAQVRSGTMSMATDIDFTIRDGQAMFALNPDVWGDCIGEYTVSIPLETFNRYTGAWVYDYMGEKFYEMSPSEREEFTLQSLEGIPEFIFLRGLDPLDPSDTLTFAIEITQQTDPDNNEYIKMDAFGHGRSGDLKVEASAYNSHLQLKVGGLEQISMVDLGFVDRPSGTSVLIVNEHFQAAAGGPGPLTPMKIISVCITRPDKNRQNEMASRWR